MSFPPSLKSIVPSLKIEKEKVTLSLGDLKALLPSLRFDSQVVDDPFNGNIEISIKDLRNILGVALAGIEVDDEWYLSQVDGLRMAIQREKFKSAAEHYVLHGYLEGRLPKRPVVDERFYLKQNPDVAAAVKAGKLKSGFDHFVSSGYSEGRLPLSPIMKR